MDRTEAIDYIRGLSETVCNEFSSGRRDDELEYEEKVNSALRALGVTPEELTKLN